MEFQNKDPDPTKNIKKIGWNDTSDYGHRSVNLTEFVL